MLPHPAPTSNLSLTRKILLLGKKNLILQNEEISHCWMSDKKVFKNIYKNKKAFYSQECEEVSSQPSKNLLIIFQL